MVDKTKKATTKAKAAAAPEPEPQATLAGPPDDEEIVSGDANDAQVDTEVPEAVEQEEPTTPEEAGGATPEEASEAMPEEAGEATPNEAGGKDPEDPLPAIQTYEEATEVVEFKEIGQKITPKNQQDVLKSLTLNAQIRNPVIGKIFLSDDSEEVKRQRLAVGWFGSGKRAHKIHLGLENAKKEIAALRERERLMGIAARSAEADAKQCADALMHYRVITTYANPEDSIVLEDLASAGGPVEVYDIEGGAEEGEVQHHPVAPGKISTKFPKFYKSFGEFSSFPHFCDADALSACYRNTIDWYYRKGMLACEYCNKSLSRAYERDEPIYCCYKCCRAVYCRHDCAAAHRTHQFMCQKHQCWSWGKPAQQIAQGTAHAVVRQATGKGKGQGKGQGKAQFKGKQGKGQMQAKGGRGRSASASASPSVWGTSNRKRKRGRGGAYGGGAYSGGDYRAAGGGAYGGAEGGAFDDSGMY